MSRARRVLIVTKRKMTRSTIRERLRSGRLLFDGCLAEAAILSAVDRNRFCPRDER